MQIASFVALTVAKRDGLTFFLRVFLGKDAVAGAALRYGRFASSCFISYPATCFGSECARVRSWLCCREPFLRTSGRVLTVMGVHRDAVVHDLGRREASLH